MVRYISPGKDPQGPGHPDRSTDQTRLLWGEGHAVVVARVVCRGGSWAAPEGAGVGWLGSSKWQWDVLVEWQWDVEWRRCDEDLQGADCVERDGLYCVRPRSGMGGREVRGLVGHQGRRSVTFKSVDRQRRRERRGCVFDVFVIRASSLAPRGSSRTRRRSRASSVRWENTSARQARRTA